MNYEHSTHFLYTTLRLNFTKTRPLDTKTNVFLQEFIVLCVEDHEYLQKNPRLCCSLTRNRYIDHVYSRLGLHRLHPTWAYPNHDSKQKSALLYFTLDPTHKNHTHTSPIQDTDSGTITWRHVKTVDSFFPFVPCFIIFPTHTPPKNIFFFPYEILFYFYTNNTLSVPPTHESFRNTIPILKFQTQIFFSPTETTRKPLPFETYFSFFC